MNTKTSYMRGVCWRRARTSKWQEVTSKKSKLKKQKLDHESLPSFENNSGVPPRKIIEVKDTWVNVRATMDTGAAGHVMPAEMFGDRIKDLCEKTIPFKSAKGVHWCIKFRSANVVKPLISMRQVVQAGNVVVLDEKIRTFESIETTQSSSWM